MIGNVGAPRPKSPKISPFLHPFLPAILTSTHHFPEETPLGPQNPENFQKFSPLNSRVKIGSEPCRRSRHFGPKKYTEKR